MGTAAVLFVQNIVMYEALKSADALDAKKPVDVYWLDIDPAYVAAARKKGVTTDRVDVRKQENMGWGLMTCQEK